VAKCEEEGDYEYARMLDLEQCWYNGIDDAYDEARSEVQRMFYGDDDLDEIESAVMDACDDALKFLRR
jgi:hypothetical protein